jgi:RluA family pseudouridine synthase
MISKLGVSIIHEDEGLLVIDKPVGISVVDEYEVGKTTIKEWVKDRYKIKYLDSDLGSEFEQRCGIVHRLDKETSGVLLIAKTKEAFDYLKGLFKYRRVRKEYQAVVYGAVKEDRFEIAAPIQRDKSNGLLYVIDKDGRDSTTEFVVKSRFKLDGNDFSYLYAFPKTGRTHQIRVHLRALGHPIANDSKYANNALRALSESVYPRMMLHAKKVTFTDWNGDVRVFESPYSLSDYLPASR